MNNDNLNSYLIEINYNPGFGSRNNEEYNKMENDFMNILIKNLAKNINTQNEQIELQKINKELFNGNTDSP